jgi:hypothetical protein
MNSVKYKQIVEFIEKCTNVQEINSARAQVQAFRLQSGGHSAELSAKVRILMEEINNKEKELLKL